MKAPYLGRIDLFWCQECNVPVLEKMCAACDGTTQKVQITPPGDVRPAFEKDINAINRAAEEQFGAPLITDERISLLNSVPGFDRFDEIIVDGVVVGALRFDVERLQLEFMPRPAGAMRIWGQNAKKGFVSVAEDAAQYILEGKSVLMPGVVDFDRDLKDGQEVIVTCRERVIAVGKTRFSGKAAETAKKGMFVKVRKRAGNNAVQIPSGGQDISLLLKANKKVIGKIEAAAIAFIKKTIKAQDLPVVVSFSGGKDSLATLLLVRKVAEPKVLFVDTGIEFPETLNYIKKISKELDFKLLTAKAEDRFWKGIEVFGMSGRDYRWCCKVSKLGPVAKVASEHFPSGFLNFIGQRRYESEIRAKSGRIWRNTWLPRQLSASPIQNWTALHIWLYLFKEGALSNPLYEMGFERIGCWVCPSSSLAEIHSFKALHPDMWQRFEGALLSQGFSEDEVRFGFWRWRRLPKGQNNLKESLNLEAGKPKKVLQSYKADRKRAKNLASAFGSAVTEDISLRAGFCLGCGICLAHCAHWAIEFRGGKIWIGEDCIGCRKCHLRCPIVKYLYQVGVITNHDS
jgi:phosphoadenosine phosphosulfate reductase